MALLLSQSLLLPRRFGSKFVRQASTSQQDQGWGEKMKNIAKRYGPVAIGFHLSVEAAVLGGFYFAVTHDLDVPALLDKVEGYTGMHVPISPTASNLLVAFLLTTSLTGLPRTILTVVATPWIARWIGWKKKKI